ncbi:hypothetical protein BDP55DRAFT_295117 [Colletotrichum godetiae]|uniref:Uncharacterized protein n=1 Tax=Colletotrichum godetiae TaxID=1209918 RepID=A0AAJ0ETM5_9PEZI|nr:uncharacterized protein BDP55DRAFT_295117 [Colletotrichum godetiae]KAK1671440.1 hypothetical protein BDP55DRAFT_295117 [Colletotrichum godetiae]
MSDVQIVMGLGVLISGFHGLLRTLSGYHWLMITNIAWFSAVTHLGALSHLRNYYYIHKSRRLWRSPLIFSVALMLVITMAIGFPARITEIEDGIGDTKTLPNTHVICFWYSDGKFRPPPPGFNGTLLLTLSCLLV